MLFDVIDHTLADRSVDCALQLAVNCQSVDCRQDTILPDASGDQRAAELFPEPPFRILSPVDGRAC